MQHRDPQYSNVISLRSTNNDNVHTNGLNELVIEEYDQWSNSATADAISFCGACGFDGESWNQAA